MGYWHFIRAHSSLPQTIGDNEWDRLPEVNWEGPRYRTPRFNSSATFPIVLMGTDLYSFPQPPDNGFPVTSIDTPIQSVLARVPPVRILTHSHWDLIKSYLESLSHPLSTDYTQSNLCHCCDSGGTYLTGPGWTRDKWHVGDGVHGERKRLESLIGPSRFLGTSIEFNTFNNSLKKHRLD